MDDIATAINYPCEHKKWKLFSRIQQLLIQHICLGVWVLVDSAMAQALGLSLTWTWTWSQTMHWGR